MNNIATQRRDLLFKRDVMTDASTSVKRRSSRSQWLHVQSLRLRHWWRRRHGLHDHWEVIAAHVGTEDSVLMYDVRWTEGTDGQHFVLDAWCDSFVAAVTIAQDLNYHEVRPWEFPGYDDQALVENDTRS